MNITIPFHQGEATLVQGDVFDGAEFLKAAGIKVNMIVTSPPYWGLRVNRGTERLWTVSKAQEECPHAYPHKGEANSSGQYRQEQSAFVESGLEGEHYTGATRWQHVAEEAREKGEKVRDVREGAWEGTPKPTTKFAHQGSTETRKYPTMAAEGKPILSSALCTLCGAWWGSLGLEPVADCRRPNGELCAGCYVCNTIVILRALREILADDGLVFWNIADSYIGGGRGQRGSDKQQSVRGSDSPVRSLPVARMKPKDLAGIPGRVVQALQGDGWYRRSDIIWVKGVSFNKRGVRELLKPYRKELEGAGVYEELALHLEENSYAGNNMPESVRDRPTRGYEYVFMLSKQSQYYSDMDAVREQHTDESLARYGRNSNVDGSQPYAMKQGPRGSDAGRNARNVWVFPTSGFGWQLCSPCGTVYDQKEYKALPKIRKKVSWTEKAKLDGGPVEGDYPNHQDGGDTGLMAEKGIVTVGICMKCGSTEGWGGHFSSFPITLPEHAILMGSRVGDIVLDPFAGTGTSLLAAIRHGREAIGFELSADYAKIATERLRRELGKINIREGIDKEQR